MDNPNRFEIVPIGRVRSSLKQRADAPKQGWEGAPDAHLDVEEGFAEAVEGIAPGRDILVFTWLHQARREVLKVRPRNDPHRRLTGVFATRSPDRPNPVGLHRVKVLGIDGARSIHVQGLEAIDGTPIVDLKPVLDRAADW